MSNLDKILESYELKRFIKIFITIVFTGFIALYGDDPRYILFAPFIDRIRAYLFRRLNID
ncbi:MAG: hypothetical protein KAK00_00275 [Nanoarchaeota archaeon]|nr:hypothetical protein [Nanoarchaeota archaeon]